MTKRTPLAFLIVWVCFLLLAALLSPSPGRASDDSNLLQNPGFEEGTIPWLSSPSAATFVVTDTAEYVHSGIWAASLNKEGGAVPIYIYQDVPVVGGGYYTLSGWVYNYKDSPIGDWAMLRIDWRNSQGSLFTVDSQKLYGDEPGYHERRIPYDGGDSVQAPAAATIARIKCMAYIQEADPETPVFFDELSFTFQGSNWRVYLPLVVKNY